MVKLFTTILVALALVGLTSTAFARNTTYHLSIKDVLRSDEAKDKLGRKVRFYFGKNSSPGTKKDLGDFVANKKTNALNKSDKEACRIAFLSAMIQLRDRAVAEGGDAVVDIRSYYKKKPNWDRRKYECHAGTTVAAVALKGRVIKRKRE